MHCTDTPGITQYSNNVGPISQCLLGTKDLENSVFTVFCLALSTKDSVKTEPASLLLCPWGQALNETPPSCIVERYSYIHK